MLTVYQFWGISSRLYRSSLRDIREVTPSRKEHPKCRVVVTITHRSWLLRRSFRTWNSSRCDCNSHRFMSFTYRTACSGLLRSAKSSAKKSKKKIPKKLIGVKQLPKCSQQPTSARCIEVSSLFDSKGRMSTPDALLPFSPKSELVKPFHKASECTREENYRVSW